MQSDSARWRIARARAEPGAGGLWLAMVAEAMSANPEASDQFIVVANRLPVEPVYEDGDPDGKVSGWQPAPGGLVSALLAVPMLVPLLSGVTALVGMLAAIGGAALHNSEQGV